METPKGTLWRTSYSLTDHLGNVRAEFVAHDGGQVELLQQTDYPCGTELPTTGGIKANGHMDLAHELSHAFDSDRGLLDDRKEQGVSRTEWQAVQRENMIRSQLGHPLRTHYKIATDPQGKCVRGLAPRILTDDNKPLPLPW